MKKKIFANLAIIFILTGVFTHDYIHCSSIPVYDGIFSYAAADNWDSCDTSDLVTAFRYYCKSRNLAINGSIADALTSFTTTTFNNICSTLGIDPTTLSAELKKTTEGNLGLRFLFSNTGITAYNRIFAEFLQNNDLEVGDSVDNKVIYTEKTFTDDDGNTCGVYVFEDRGTYNKPIITYGSPYIYDYNGLLNLYNAQGSPYNIPFHIGGEIYYLCLFGSINTATQRGDLYLNSQNATGQDNSWKVYGLWDGVLKAYGNPAIMYDQLTGKLWLGSFRHSDEYGNDRVYNRYLLNGEPDDSNITVNTPNNTVINNNTYNNNYVIIYNDGDTYISDDDDEPLPTTPPDGGGGGGDDPTPPSPDDPEIPVEPTPDPDPVVPNWDIEFPEMPEGNEWLLYGLEKKFPWDIPFNLMFMLSLFAADPETPHFEGTIDLKVVQWDYDIDLAPFDEIAGYVRDFLFIGFLLGLMLITHKLIWG